MKKLLFASLLTSLLCSTQAQVRETPANVQTIFGALVGDFEWETIRPSENKVLRTGTKSTKYHLDSLVLFGNETFDNSEIIQTSFFSYNPVDSVFFAVSIYNIDLGPHSSKGIFVNDSMVEFQSNDSNKHFLTILPPEKYHWTYKRLIDGVWEDRDLKIIFTRKSN